MTEKILQPFLHRILQNTAFGLLVGCLLAFLLSFALEASVAEDAKKFYTYLASALISVLAASLTLAGVFASIDNQNRLADDARSRKLASARALLPASLSEMCEVCSDGMKFSHNFVSMEAKLGIEELEKASLSRRQISNEVVTIFRDVIELTDDPVVTQRLAGALRDYQVFLARWRGTFRDDGNIMPLPASAVRQRTTDWAYLYAVVSSVFDFARGDSETIELDVTETEISSALNVSGIAGIYGENFGDEIGLCARNFQRRF